MGSTTAFDTRYDVSTQVLSSWLTDRLPAMCGRETLAMLVSSTSMSVAIVTTRAIAQGVWPLVQPVSKYEGRAGAAAGLAAPFPDALSVFSVTARSGSSVPRTSPAAAGRAPAAAG